MPNESFIYVSFTEIQWPISRLTLAVFRACKVQEEMACLLRMVCEGKYPRSMNEILINCSENLTQFCV